MTQTFTGRCLCGQVSYVVRGQPVVVAQCHCTECRRSSGTGHSVGAMFLAADVSVTGHTKEYKYISDKTSEVTKASCARCGSPIFGRNSHNRAHITLPLGTMDDSHGLAVEVVIFERDKPHWDQLGPEVASYRTQPDWTPPPDSS